MVLGIVTVGWSQVVSDTVKAVSINQSNQPINPVEAVKDFFKDFHAKDTTALRQHIQKGTQLSSMIISKSRGKQLISSDVDQFLKGIANIPDSLSFEERLLEIKWMGDDHLASVSTTYEFYYDGKFTHNGTNLFILTYIDKRWKITGLTDSRFYP